jgi:hypothetical protein
LYFSKNEKSLNPLIEIKILAAIITRVAIAIGGIKVFCVCLF